MDEPVLFEVNDRGIATVTLNRPDRLNAINLEMRDLLWTYLGSLREMPDVRAVVFRGAGACFSAGADISEFGTAPSIVAARRARHERDVWGALLSLPIPTIAVLHGYCFGAGLELPLCCDRRIAVEGATFALPEVTLGYIPSACGTQTLPRTIPPGAAMHMILTGERIDAEAALRWGLVSQVEPEDELEFALRDVVTEAKRGPEPFMERRVGMTGTIRGV